MTTFSRFDTDIRSRVTHGSKLGTLKTCRHACKCTVLTMQTHSFTHTVLAHCDSMDFISLYFHLLQALTGHGQLSFKANQAPKTAGTAVHAAREHKESDAATAAQREAIDSINKQYKDKFGFIFLTSAFGRGADDILNEGRTRLNNSRSTEVQRAKIEEGRILAGRLYEHLAKLFSNSK